MTPPESSTSPPPTGSPAGSSGSSRSTPASARGLACPAVVPTLHACEQSLDRWDGDGGSPLPERRTTIPALRTHLQACPACAARHGRRLAALEARQALAGRELPVDAFEGFFEAIHERVPFTAPGGGMSATFLDAPRALRIWRSAAVAASLILALGVGYVATGGLGAAGDDGAASVRRLHDPRDQLLPSFDDGSSTAWPASQAGFLLRPMHAPVTRGHEAFFEPATPEPIFVEGGGGGVGEEGIDPVGPGGRSEPGAREERAQDARYR